MNASSAVERADLHWIDQVLALGALGEGYTRPNPRVGCLVVHGDTVVGRGCHRAPGRPHAEAQALAEAGERARGATLYVNLEPCAHHGRTPPCADAIVKSGVRRVVASIQDPNPLVDGRGFERLRDSGIEVRTAVRAAEAEELNAAFLHFHRHRRPLVTLKAAITLDGMLSAAAGRSRWISGEPARRFAHRLRLRHDAVLVGAGTARRDDPRLGVRLPRTQGSILRVVLAPRLDLDPHAQLFRGGLARPRIYAARSTADAAERALEDRADVVRLADEDGRFAVCDVLADLTAIGVQSLLVEGGARTFAAFLDAGVADRGAIFVSRKMIGARGATPLLDRAAVDDPAQAWRLREPRQFALGRDLLLLGRLAAAGT